MGFLRSSTKVAPENAAPTGKKQKKGNNMAATTELAAGSSTSPALAIDAHPMTIMLLGCDGAGKTTLANALAGTPLTETPKPTTGFQNFNGQQLGVPAPLTIFDAGGGAGVRSIWDDYYPATHGAIFIVDAADSGGQTRPPVH